MTLSWYPSRRSKSWAHWIALLQRNRLELGHGREYKFTVIDEYAKFDASMYDSLHDLYWGSHLPGKHVTLAHLLKGKKYVWPLDRQEHKTANLLPRFFPVCLLPFCGFVDPRSLHSEVSLDFGNSDDRAKFKTSWASFQKESRDVLSAVQLIAGEWLSPEVLYQHFVTDWGTLARDLAASEVSSEKEASR